MSEIQKKILVVDDETIIAMELELHLTRMGYEVVGIADSGLAAIEKARELSPDLIMMDIVMPGKLDGIEAAREIVATMDIPVIFLTAFADPEYINRAKEIGPFGYLVKPYEDRELQAAIEVALYKKGIDDELKRKNEELRRLSRDLDNYVNFVSHDLRAPLRHIKALSLFLNEDYGDNLDETGQEYLRKISATCDDAETMIYELLKLAKITDKTAMREKVNVNDVIRNLEQELEFFLKDHNGRIEVEEPLPTIFSNHAWLKELFFNLITNGIKYNDKKEKVVRIGFKNEDEKLFFSVADNGLGIKSKHREEIFEPFKRLHGKEEKEKEGIGLGLSLCERIVESHGGKIWVESKIGEGSTFFFTLPTEVLSLTT